MTPRSGIKTKGKDIKPTSDCLPEICYSLFDWSYVAIQFACFRLGGVPSRKRGSGRDLHWSIKQPSLRDLLWVSFSSFGRIVPVFLWEFSWILPDLASRPFWKFPLRTHPLSIFFADPNVEFGGPPLQRHSLARNLLGKTCARRDICLKEHMCMNDNAYMHTILYIYIYIHMHMHIYMHTHGYVHVYVYLYV